MKTRLWDWASVDIKEFKDLIHEIQAGNAFIERLVQIAGANRNYSPTESTASLMSKSLILEEAAAPHLKALSHVFQSATKPADTILTLELKELQGIRR